MTVESRNESVIHDRLAVAFERRIRRAWSVHQAVLIGVAEPKGVAELVRHHTRELAERKLTGRAVADSLVHADVRFEGRGERLAVKHVGSGTETRLVHSTHPQGTAVGATEGLKAGGREILFEHDVVDAIRGIEKPVRVGGRAGQHVMRAAGVPRAERRIDLRRPAPQRAAFGVALVPVHGGRKDVPARAHPTCVLERVRRCGEHGIGRRAQRISRDSSRNEIPVGGHLATCDAANVIEEPLRRPGPLLMDPSIRIPPDQLGLVAKE